MTPPARIGIDAYFMRYELRGIGKYIERLCTGIVRLDSPYHFVIYGPRERLGSILGLPNVTVIDPGLYPWPIWEQLVLPRRAHTDGLSLLHFTANTGPILPSDKLRYLVTIHDVMCLLPKTVLPRPTARRQKLGTIYRRAALPAGARKAAHIIAISEHSRSEIQRILDVSRDKISVVYHGVEPPNLDFSDLTADERALCDRISRRPFLFALGSADPRKNTGRILRAFASCRGQLKDREALIVVGLRRAESDGIMRLSASLGLGDDVLFKDYVSDTMLSWLYAHARALLYPSLYEGFGFPALEAMSYGTPVVTSNTSSLPEIAGSAALLIDPYSDSQLAAGILRISGDSALRARLGNAGMDQAKNYQWQNTIQCTLGVYSRLVQPLASDVRKVTA